MRRHNRFWILFPAIFLLLLDVVVTYLFQPAEYWRVSYEYTTESSPHGLLLMRYHPLAFLAFIVAYLLVVSFLVYRLPPPGHKVIALAVVVGHTAGVHSWLADRYYWLMIFNFIFFAAVTVFSWQKAEARWKYGGSYLKL
jgi:hypothetical protein